MINDIMINRYKLATYIPGRSQLAGSRNFAFPYESWRYY